MIGLTYSRRAQTPRPRTVPSTASDARRRYRAAMARKARADREEHRREWSAYMTDRQG